MLAASYASRCLFISIIFEFHFLFLTFYFLVFFSFFLFLHSHTKLLVLRFSYLLFYSQLQPPCVFVVYFILPNAFAFTFLARVLNVKCKFPLYSFRHIPSLCFFIVPSFNSSLGRCIFLCSLFLSIPRLSLSRRFAASSSAVSRYISFSVPLSLSHVLAAFPVVAFYTSPAHIRYCQSGFRFSVWIPRNKVSDSVCVTATAD